MKNRKFSPSRRKVVCLPLKGFGQFFAVPSCNHENSLYERLVRIVFFRLFDLSTSWWEVKMIDFTEYIGFFRLFGLLMGGQLSDFTGYIEFFRLFDFSTSCRQVKMIDFTDYIGFFSTFWPLAGRSTERFNWIY